MLPGLPVFLLSLAYMLALAAPPAFAGDAFNDPTGKLLTISQNTVIYASPPGGLKSTAEVQAIISPQSGTLNYYAATRPDKAATSYQIAEPVPMTAQAFTVTNYRDVVQGRETVRWLQIAPVGQSGVSGWVPYGSRTSPDTSLSLK